MDRLDLRLLFISEVGQQAAKGNGLFIGRYGFESCE